MTYSIRTRFTRRASAVLLTVFLLTAAAGYTLFTASQVVNRLTDQGVAALQTVARLQKVVLQVAVTVDDSAAGFTQASLSVDEAFAAAEQSRTFDTPDERELLLAASRQWREARLLALAPGHQVGMLNDRIQQVNQLLDRLVGIHEREVAQLTGQVRQAHARVALVLACSFALVAFWVSMAVIRIRTTVVRPLQQLEKGAIRLQQGDLSYRVTVDAKNEFEQVARTFNAMVDQLQRTLAQLKEQADHDALTRLYNRRAFDLYLAAAVIGAGESREPVSLLFIDLDHFKDINDQFGHQTGDTVLQHVASVITAAVRGSDFVARYGGEELAVVLPRTELRLAMALAHRICRSIRKAPFRVGEASVKVPVSIGVSSSASNQLTTEELIRHADEALYRAKYEGRDRVCGPKATVVEPDRSLVGVE